MYMYIEVGNWVWLKMLSSHCVEVWNGAVKMEAHICFPFLWIYVHFLKTVKIHVDLLVFYLLILFQAILIKNHLFLSHA